MLGPKCDWESRRWSLSMFVDLLKTDARSVKLFIVYLGSLTWLWLSNMAVQGTVWILWEAFPWFSLLVFFILFFYSFIIIISSKNKYRKHKSSMLIWVLPLSFLLLLLFLLIYFILPHSCPLSLSLSLSCPLIYPLPSLTLQLWRRKHHTASMLCLFFLFFFLFWEGATCAFDWNVSMVRLRKLLWTCRSEGKWTS